MYLNGNLQFMSLDEQRYHEALVDFPMNLLQKKNISVLVLWAGDGLAVRNLLEHKNVENITLVELDPKMIELAKTQNELKKLNKNSLENKKVKIITQDAFNFVRETKKQYDFIIADFPDPRNVELAKLYSKEFYISILGTLKNDGIFVTQSSNAFFSNKVLFSVEKTLKNVFGEATAYHRYLPSFWDWGFVIAQKNNKIDAEKLCPQMSCTFFDADYYEWTENVVENTQSNSKIREYYGEGYKKFNL